EPNGFRGLMPLVQVLVAGATMCGGGPYSGSIGGAGLDRPIGGSGTCADSAGVPGFIESVARLSWAAGGCPSEAPDLDGGVAGSPFRPIQFFNVRGSSVKMRSPVGPVHSYTSAVTGRGAQRLTQNMKNN